MQNNRINALQRGVFHGRFGSYAFAAPIAVLVRNHWRVENELHWILDVCFNEDQCRVRIENAAENLARIRRISLILLKNDKICKLGIKSKRAKAGYDRNYMLTLLGFKSQKAENM